MKIPIDRYLVKGDAGTTYDHSCAYDPKRCPMAP
jgi:hypothetical protein